MMRESELDTYSHTGEDGGEENRTLLVIHLSPQCAFFCPHSPENQPYPGLHQKIKWFYDSMIGHHRQWITLQALRCVLDVDLVFEVFLLIKNLFAWKRIWKTPKDNRRPQWVWEWSPFVLRSFWWPSDLQLGWNNWRLYCCWWQCWQDLPFKGWLYSVPLQRTGKHLVSLPCVFCMINQHSGFSFDPLVFLKEFTQP